MPRRRLREFHRINNIVVRRGSVGDARGGGPRRRRVLVCVCEWITIKKRKKEYTKKKMMRSDGPRATTERQQCGRRWRALKIGGEGLPRRRGASARNGSGGGGGSTPSPYPKNSPRIIDNIGGRPPRRRRPACVRAFEPSSATPGGGEAAGFVDERSVGRGGGVEVSRGVVREGSRVYTWEGEGGRFRTSRCGEAKTGGKEKKMK